MDSNDEDQDRLFEEIIEQTDLRKWFEEQKNSNQLTIGDVYEGISIVSGAQVELHQYLMTVMRSIYNNNKAGHVVEDLPRLSSRQVVALINIFENAAIFVEDFKD